jgi:undecaprenyl-diphosphatase
MDVEILRSAVLGIVQGLTEFLPVSSSGHLEIAKFLLGEDAVGEESLMMTVMLHVATALSTIYVFRKDIWKILRELFHQPWNESQQFAIRVLISMLPAGLIGFFFEPMFETLFSMRVGFVGWMLLITASLLFFADRPREHRRPMNNRDAFWIGCAQAVALLPGISRAGSTVSAALILGIERKEAARFSFLMVVPLIIGKIGYELLLGDGFTQISDPLSLSVGFVTAFVFGVIACTWMIALVARSKLKYFGMYCIVAGIFAIVLSIVARG